MLRIIMPISSAIGGMHLGAQLAFKHLLSDRYDPEMIIVALVFIVVSMIGNFVCLGED